MKPYYSVIIPAYNAADTLEQSLRSALDQSFSNTEIIVVNDGSTDGTANLLDELKAEFPHQRLHITEQPNQGLGAARNTATQMAEGEYCALLDADDIWKINKLESCYQFLKNDPQCEVLYHPVTTFGTGKERSRGAYAIAKLTDILSEGCPIIPSASIIKTELLREFPFSLNPDFHGAEDLDLWLRLLKAGRNFKLWPENLTWYRETGGMSTDIDRHLRHVFNVYEYYYDKGYYNQTHLELARRRKYYEAARFHQKRGNRFKAERYYSAADSKSVKIAGLRFLNYLGISW